MKFNNLNRYRVGGTDSNMLLAIKPPATPSGRIYRMSPNKDAHPQHFVMGSPFPNFEITAEARKRMKLEPRSKQTVCPYSGVVAPDESFTHPDDRQAAHDMVKQAAVEDMRTAVSDMLRGVASRSKSITYRPAPRRAKTRLTFHRADLLRDLVCDHCSRDYGVYAIGLFCPDCGAPNLRLHFEREHALVNAQVELAEAQDEGLEELSYRLLGNAHEDVLTAFEATLKTVYLFGIANRPGGAPAVKPVANDFQNLERAEKRFKDLDFNPFDGLGEDDLATLRLNIQKRHIIGHNLGVVDAKFAEHANEARIGETVHLVGDDIKRFAAICQAVIDRLDEWLCGAPSPTLGSTSEQTAKSPKPKEPNKKTLADIKLNVGPLAKEIGLWMANASDNGLSNLPHGTDIEKAFPDASKRDLRKALAELESEGFVSLTHFMGGGVPYITLTSDLFAIFDPVAHGTDPYQDAGELIRRILKEANEKSLTSYSVSGRELLDGTGWPHRRLNPALSLVLSNIDDRRVSRTLDNEFAARSFIVMAEDEISLERFLMRVGEI